MTTQRFISSSNSEYVGHKKHRKHLLFTDRERTILLLVAEGMSNRQIAEHLTLSLTTVKWYVKQIFNKLGVHRRTEAVKMASDFHLMEITSSEYDPIPLTPTPLTPLIGRDNEISEIINLLNDPRARLVTIVGSGGIGKTRLVLEATRQLTIQRLGQVCFAALDSVDSLSGMIQAVASAIGFQFHGTLDIGRQLLIHLRNRKFFLLMDSFEHLLGVASYINEMLTAAPYLKILITSRARLNLSAETVYTLRGLAYPSNTDHAQDYAAFKLFMQIAHHSQPKFQPDSDDIFQICQICQLVEGLPLGIELAARWIDVLTPAQIADEIVKDIGILETTWQDLPKRHRSIRAVFEHSWQLLSDEEQVVFKKLCNFGSGFDRAAAEQVAGATLFMLSKLVDKSLLMRVEKDRFKLHELVRQFAQEKLQADVDCNTS